jgi:hypothetical protein
MKRVSFLIIISIFTLTLNAQVKVGPVVNIGFGLYSKTSDSLDLKGGISPAFGIAIQKDIAQMLSLVGSANYSFKTLETTRTNGGQKDKMNGQFFDLSLAGRFSNFDSDVKALPYGTAGLGCVFTIISKKQEKYMVGTSYKGAMPYFTVGAGIAIKMSFFSELDLSVNYNRYLVPAFTVPIDGKDARLNEFGLKMAALF